MVFQRGKSPDAIEVFLNQCWETRWGSGRTESSRHIPLKGLGKLLRKLLRLVLFFKLIYFNWRLITILWFLPYIDMNQPWVYMCFPSWTPLPHPSPSHPSGSSQCTSSEHPVSCIQPGLAICFTYGNTHVSMLYSQIIPPLPFPTESKRLFYTSVSLLLSHI